MYKVLCIYFFLIFPLHYFEDYFLCLSLAVLLMLLKLEVFGCCCRKEKSLQKTSSKRQKKKNRKRKVAGAWLTE